MSATKGLAQAKALALELLAALSLPEHMHTYAVEHLYYNDSYKEHPHSEDSTVMCVISDELPALAAMLLLRDTIKRTLDHFGGPDGEGMHDSKAYHLLKLNDTIADLCWGISYIAIFKHPSLTPTGFRTYKGHLVLVGDPVGAEKIEDNARSYVAMKVIRSVMEDKLIDAMKDGSLDKVLGGKVSLGRTDSIEDDDMMRLMGRKGGQC